MKRTARANYVNVRHPLRVDRGVKIDRMGKTGKTENGETLVHQFYHGFGTLVLERRMQSGLRFDMRPPWNSDLRRVRSHSLRLANNEYWDTEDAKQAKGDRSVGTPRFGVRPPTTTWRPHFLRVGKARTAAHNRLRWLHCDLLLIGAGNAAERDSFADARRIRTKVARLRKGDSGERYKSFLGALRCSEPCHYTNINYFNLI
jgi:hypothetical protein